MESKAKEQKKVKIIKPQVGFQEQFLVSKADIVIGGGGAGGGKMAPFTEPTLTPKGWVKMGDIGVGSDVMCPITGNPIKVLQVFPKKDLKVYKITFSDGTSSECCEDHLWRVQTRKQIERGNYQVIDVNKMLEMGVKDNRGDNRFAIDCNVPLNFEPKVVDLDPYLLGLLLGDGYLPEQSNSMVGMKVHSDECESLFNYIPKHIPKDVKISLHKQQEANCRNIAFSVSIKKYLANLGLLGKKSRDKFVPKKYLYNSAEVRKEILAGLLDADSYIEVIGGKKKKTNYFTMSPQLKDDVCELIRSLGGIASVSEADDREKYNGGICYKVNYRLPFNPFKRDRRRILFDQAGYTFHFKKRITSIDYIGLKDGQCILVDSKDHLYVTNGYNMTHNSYALLFKPLYYITDPKFRCTIFRRNRTQIENSGGLWDDSKDLYKDLRPALNVNETKLTYNCPSGGEIKFSHLEYDKNAKTYQGAQISLIGFDELTHFSAYQFFYLLTRNRSMFDGQCQMVATCNPEPDSWVAKFIDWWIGEDGYPIKERDGKLRYFYKRDKSMDSIVWGSSKAEVYRKCKDELDELAKNKNGKGDPYALIKSLTFIRGDVDDNQIMLDSQPGYKGSIAQSADDKHRLLKGNWKFRSKGTELVGIDAIGDMFERRPQRTGRRAITCDVAGKGSDSMVIMVWDGFHLEDVMTIGRSDGKQIVDSLRAMMRRWNVDARSVVFDANGVGSHIDGFIDNAIEYKSQDTTSVKGTNFKNLKAICCMNWADRLNNALIEDNHTKEYNYSIDTRLQDRVFNHKTLEEHLTEERKAIRLAPASVDGKYEIIKKSEMISILGHSPDFVEAMLMLEYLYLSESYTDEIDLIW